MLREAVARGDELDRDPPEAGLPAPDRDTGRRPALRRGPDLRRPCHRRFGDLGMITREDILRSETRALLGEDRLAEMRGTVRLHVTDRGRETRCWSPRPSTSRWTPTMRPTRCPLRAPSRSNGASAPGPSAGCCTMQTGRVAGSGAVWPRPETPVDVQSSGGSRGARGGRVSSPGGRSRRTSGSAAPAAGHRVFQVILDCADWRLVEYGRARGELPFFDRAIRDGRRTVLDSVPPFTAVAVAKLVYPEKVGIRSVTDLVHQLGGEIEGLNFVGRNPFAALDWVLPAQRQLFETFAEHGYSTVNLLRSHGLLKVGRQAQVIGPGDTVRQLPGYEGTRALTPDEKTLLSATANDIEADLLAEMAADFDVLDRLAEEGTIDFVALRVASLDLMTHSRFQTLNRTGQDDGDSSSTGSTATWTTGSPGWPAGSTPATPWSSCPTTASAPRWSTTGGRSSSPSATRSPGRIEGSPPIRQVTGWIADLMGVPTEWPGAGTADWIPGPPRPVAPATDATRAPTGGGPFRGRDEPASVLRRTELEQRVATLHRLARRDVDLADPAGALGGDLVLHLHRLEHHHALAGLDLFALLHQQRHHPAGHVGGDRLRPAAGGRAVGRAGEMGQGIGDLDRVGGPGGGNGVALAAVPAHRHLVLGAVDDQAPEAAPVAQPRGLDRVVGLARRSPGSGRRPARCGRSPPALPGGRSAPRSTSHRLAPARPGPGGAPPRATRRRLARLPSPSPAPAARRRARSWCARAAAINARSGGSPSACGSGGGSSPAASLRSSMAMSSRPARKSSSRSRARKSGTVVSIPSMRSSTRARSSRAIAWVAVRGPRRSASRPSGRSGWSPRRPRRRRSRCARRAPRAAGAGRSGPATA